MIPFKADIDRAKTANPVVIVGAGITGCVIGYELSKRGRKVIIVEKDSRVGGLAKSFHYGGGFSFDIGPHRFHTQKEKISSFINNVLKDDSITIFRNTAVYFLEKYYPWPLRPTIMFDLPLHITVKSAWELLWMALSNKKKKICNFEDYILVNYGPTLYNVFFKEYTQKFLGLPTKDIHPEWAREAMKRAIVDEQIASRNLLDILKLTLTFKPTQTEFIYPVKGGIGLFCERLKDKIREHGGEIFTDSFITDINYSDGKIEEIFLNKVKIRPETLVWTASLNEVCRLLNLPFNNLSYLSLLLYNVETDDLVKKNYQWCYYGDKKIIFSRITAHGLFSENMAPEGKSGLCVEVNCREGDLTWNNPETLIERIKKDLVKTGLASHVSKIGKIHIEKVKNAYPVYTVEYPQRLKKVKEDLSRFENLVLAGRTGLFWYNNMDDCIENGLETAENIYEDILSGHEVVTA